MGRRRSSNQAMLQLIWPAWHSNASGLRPGGSCFSSVGAALLFPTSARVPVQSLPLRQSCTPPHQSDAPSNWTATWVGWEDRGSARPEAVTKPSLRATSKGPECALPRGPGARYLFVDFDIGSFCVVPCSTLRSKDDRNAGRDRSIKAGFWMSPSGRGYFAPNLPNIGRDLAQRASSTS